MSATVAYMPQPEEPEYIREVKKNLSHLSRVERELARETNRLLTILQMYEESK